MALPTDRTSSSTIPEHVDDHNTLHTQHNELEGHAADTTAVHGIDDTSALETTTGSAAKVAAHEADTTSVHSASSVTFTPTGNIAATDVQAAIAEMDAEKATTVHDHVSNLFTPQTPPAYQQGLLFYNSDDEVLGFYNNEAEITLNIGQETWVRVRNSSGATITNGSAVYINGSHASGVPTIALAKADVRATANVIGLATHSIENNTIGYVTTIGIVHGLNTGAFANGDRLYLSATTAGALTATEPTLPNISVGVAFVTKSASGTGGTLQVLIRLPATPLTHASTHNAGGGDALAIDAAAATGSLRTLGTGSTQAAVGNHAHSGTYVALPAGAPTNASQILGLSDDDPLTTDWIDPPSGGSDFLGFYGDGSDGVVNFDGSTTVLGLAPSSGVYTLTRDIFLATGSQVSGTAVIKTANFRIFCTGTFTIGSTATINNDGNAASGTTGGTATAAQVLTATIAGPNGTSGASGTQGPAPSNPMLGATGGTGGASSGGGVGGGTGAATTSAPNVNRSLPRSIFHLLYDAQNSKWNWAGAGSSGSAAASSTGGGGGAGGGGLLLLVYDLVVNGTLRAAGGAGGAASGAGTGAGGGGGGGGGVLMVVYHTKSGSASTFTAATNAPGGAGGALQGAGRTGAAGSNGSVYEIVN